MDADLKRQADFLLKRAPPDSEHERYACLLVATIYRPLIGDMVSAGFLSAERAAELLEADTAISLGVEDKP